MKKLLVVALVMAQPIWAVPVAAAELGETQQPQMGAFGGFRLRLPLDGSPRQRQVRAGLTLAPTLSSQTISGETRMRIGEGAELSFTGERPLTLTLSGRPVSRLLPGGSKLEDERRLGISTVGYVAIGAGVVAIVGAFVFYQDAKDGSLTDCCE